MQPYRERSRRLIIFQYLFQCPRRHTWPEDVDFRVWHVGRRKKRESLRVVMMQMTEQQGYLQGAYSGGGTFDPTSGSTIGVYVDGVFQGNPVYNIARLDISSLFPGYCNSSGAHSYFDLDTTAFTNGVHTIAWIAEDSAGNADGIGSRYFSVKNTQSAGRVGRRTADGERKIEDGVVEFIKGYKTDGEPQKLYPDKDGNIKITIFELERLELRLPGLSSGYMTVNGQRRPLPVGSTVDTERGVFYWMPGPGFRGKYTFVFIAGDKTGKPVSKYVTITIRPGSSRKDV